MIGPNRLQIAEVDMSLTMSQTAHADHPGTVVGFVAVREAEELRSLCKALLMLPSRRIDWRQTDGFREHTSSVLS